MRVSKYHCQSRWLYNFDVSRPIFHARFSTLLMKQSALLHQPHLNYLPLTTSTTRTLRHQRLQRDDHPTKLTTSRYPPIPNLAVTRNLKQTKAHRATPWPPAPRHPKPQPSPQPPHPPHPPATGGTPAPTRSPAGKKPPPSPTATYKKYSGTGPRS